MAKAEQERQAAVIRAEGEAEAAELISSALKASGVGLIEVTSHTVAVHLYMSYNYDLSLFNCAA